MAASTSRRVTILAPGSRGDVAPCVALGRGLESEGYQVRVVAHPSLSPLFEGQGPELRPMSGYSRQAVEDAVAALYAALARPVPSPSRVREAWRRIAQTYEDQLVTQCLEACAGSSAVLFTIIDIAGLSVAEKLGIPAYPVFSAPVTRSHVAPHALVLPFADSLGPFNYLSHLVGEQVSWQTFRPIVNRARRTLGLAPMSRRGPFGRLIREQQPIFYHYSPTLLPRPRDWSPHAHVTGYWFLDPSVPPQLPDRVAEFLDRGSKPIWVGFGSMGSLNSESRLTTVLEAAKVARVRVLLETSWPGIDSVDLGPDVLVVQDVPHVAVLAHVAAVVHHGGVGTTHAVLRAGVPSVVCAALGDQFLWGSRVVKAGAAPPMVGPRRMTVEHLARAIRQAVSDPGIAAQAAAVGRGLRAEDGTASAVAALRGYLDAPRRVGRAARPHRARPAGQPAQR
jgi:UDP:flavonoid glycosyltransferase YjiC (YdhE family)